MKQLIILLTALLLIGCNKPKDSAATLFLDWSPNTNHIGIFVARELGFYKDIGIDLKIFLPGKSTPELIVASNQGDFAISFQSHLIEAKEKGLPLVSIAAIIQHSTSGYASLLEKKIQSPKDFQGKTYGAYGSELEKAKLNLIMQKDGVKNPQVKIVQVGNTDLIAAASSKDIDFVNIFYGWTGIEAQIRGVKLNFVNTASYALDSYEPIIIANSNKARSNPNLVKNFLSATAKGYAYAIKHPNEAAAILTRLYPELSSELVIGSLEYLKDKYIDDAPYWGIQDEARWQEYIDFMRKNDVIKEPLKATDLFTNDHLATNAQQ